MKRLKSALKEFFDSFYFSPQGERFTALVPDRYSKYSGHRFLTRFHP